MGVVLMNACEKPDREVDKIVDGTNFAVFQLTKTAVTQIADGAEYLVDVPVKLTGPALDDASGDVLVTYEVDTDATTAVEGTHYRIDDYTVTLKKSNNYLGNAKLVMLTDGIVTPLATSPILVLKVKSATGDATVINSGKALEITLNYACFSDLAGEYNVVTVRGDGATDSWTETITQTGIGQYHTQYVGLWNPPINADAGFAFTDVCGVISMPEQGLADTYTNSVYHAELGTVNPDGSLHIVYIIEFAAGNNTYTADYTKVK